MLCHNCGFDNPNDAAYCQSCGAYINSSAPYDVKSPMPEPEGPQAQEPNDSYFRTPAQPPMPTSSPARNNAITSMVLGIVGLVLSLTYFASPISLVITIIGLVLALKARRELPVGVQDRNYATTGLVLSIVGLVLSAIFFLSCTVCVGLIGALDDTLNSFYYYW